MTDKQIQHEQSSVIIDGVDVSGCSFYEDNPKYRMWGTCDCMRSMVDQSGYDELAGAECKGYNCYYKQLKRKEQECETLASQLDFEVQKKECLEQECKELKKIINEAKNSKLDLKSFLVGEAIQNEYEEQLDQLKAENDELKKTVDDLLHKPEIQDKILWKIDNEALLGSKDAYIYKLEQTLTEIKTDILDIREGISYFWVIDKCDKILQKISEVVDEN